MSHAWLITGPPGSGRSNAARAFAAALQCERGGCGECNDCRTSLSGAHPDVTLVRTEQLSIGVDEVRDLVRRAAMSPTLRRLAGHRGRGRRPGHRAGRRRPAEEHRGAGAAYGLDPLRADADDVVATIRSRCRLLTLSDAERRAVARLLQTRDGIEPELAAYAARVAQGHVGRARVLARDEAARDRRREVLQIPLQLQGLGACLSAAAKLVEACAEEAAAATGDLDARERSALGGGAGVRHPGGQAAAGPGGDQGTGGSAEGAGQTVPARRHRSGPDRADRLLSRRAQHPDRVRRRPGERGPAARRLLCWPGSRRRSRRCGGSMRCLAAGRRWRAMWRRCSPSRRP